MAKKTHIHKYTKRALGEHSVWACALPECNHYMPLHMTDFVEGKASFCWECGEQFILSSTAMKENKPRCDKCRNPLIGRLEEYISQRENGSLRDEPEENEEIPLSSAMKQRLGID